MFKEKVALFIASPFQLDEALGLLNRIEYKELYIKWLTKRRVVRLVNEERLKSQGIRYKKLGLFESLFMNYDLMIVGDLRKMLRGLRFYTKSEVVIIDDGIGTIYSVQHCNANKLKDVKFYTKYEEIIGDKIVKFSLPYRRNFPMVHQIKDEVWIIGSPHVAKGRVSLVTYTSKLSSISSCYPDKIKRYFPHRHEDEIGLAGLCIEATDSFWSVVKSELLIPSIVIGTTSTLLLDLHLFYPEISVIVAEFSSDEIVPGRKDEILRIQQDLKEWIY